VSWLEICFWSCACGVAYVYLGYPLLIAVAARLFGHALRRVGPLPRLLSIVIAAHDEETAIVRRIRDLRARIAATGIPGEIIVVSDGSTDQTAELARANAGDDVQVVELGASEGKAAALTAGSAAATGEILVFADVRQAWAPDALHQLLENFRDPAVGAASGNLRLESAPGVLAGVGVYWNYEKWLRAQESRLHSLVGVTGAISAVRRELFRPIPPGTLLDDVYWPLQVAMQGRRVVHDENAVVLDRLPESAGDEFRRKVRTLCGNFQLVKLCPAALLPWRNPVWLQLVSHKLLRLAVPWALLLLLLINVFLPGPFYRITLATQVALYLLGLLGMRRDERPRLAITNAASSFLLLNAAALVSFWTWALGRSDRTWKKSAYQAMPVEYAGRW
jgi:cellulose synthase/poly-beta-1,6-N-acetylglucosamine synthase-like glycosyltransferase